MLVTKQYSNYVQSLCSQNVTLWAFQVLIQITVKYCESFCFYHHFSQCASGSHFFYELILFSLNFSVISQTMSLVWREICPAFFKNHTSVFKNIPPNLMSLFALYFSLLTDNAQPAEYFHLIWYFHFIWYLPLRRYNVSSYAQFKRLILHIYF